MRTIKIVSLVAALSFVFGLSMRGTTQAQDNTVQVSGSLSGFSVAEVPIDFDLDSSPAPSGDTTGTGKQNVGGGVTFRGVSEADPHPGTGCPFPPLAGTQSCNIDGVTDGCLFDVVGGASAFRFDSSGDIATTQATGGTGCVNFNSANHFLPPYDDTATVNFKYTGGSGKFAGTTGNGQLTQSGQILFIDESGHSFSWFTARYSGTMTKP